MVCCPTQQEAPADGVLTQQEAPADGVLPHTAGSTCKWCAATHRARGTY